MAGEVNIFKLSQCSALFGQLHCGARPIGHIGVRLHCMRVRRCSDFAFLDLAHYQHAHDVTIPLGVDEIASPQDDRLYARGAIAFLHGDAHAAFFCGGDLRCVLVQNAGLVTEVVNVAGDNHRCTAGLSGGYNL